jgi:hypothetical protein
MCKVELIRRPKKAIERAYTLAEAMGIAVWCEDEAGPYSTQPYAGHSWQAQGQAAQQPHEYFREGTAKMITLFHPQTGQVRVKGVDNTRNETLHGFLRSELATILAALPDAPPVSDLQANRDRWESFREGVTVKATLSADLPALRMLLVMDNLVGHKNLDWLLWCFERGILPIYTPLGGSWLNMAESIQRILKRRALDSFYPRDVQTMIDRLEAVARGWKRKPTPFVWKGKRHARRQRARARRLHRLGGSGACSIRPIERLNKWRRSQQLTH